MLFTNERDFLMAWHLQMCGPTINMPTTFYKTIYQAKYKGKEMPQIICKISNLLLKNHFNLTILVSKIGIIIPPPLKWRNSHELNVEEKDFQCKHQKKNTPSHHLLLLPHVVLLLHHNSKTYHNVLTSLLKLLLLTLLN